jgi:hypothetical protein
MLWLCVFLLLSTCLAAQQKPIGTQASTEKTAAKEPFDLTEIEQLLRASLTPKRIIALVEQYGVSFELTDNAEKELRKLGADDRLLLVIAKNRVQPTSNVTAQPPFPQPIPPAPQSALTWTDRATGLMWAKESNSSNVTWNQAKSYCSNLRLGGYSNWRLPTIGELEAIYDPTQNVGGCHVKDGIKFDHDMCWSWSSSTGIDSGEAWGFGFISGAQSSIGIEETRYDTRALCVRHSGK